MCYGIIFQLVEEMPSNNLQIQDNHDWSPFSSNSHYYISRFQHSLNPIKVVATQRTLRKNSIIKSWTNFIFVTILLLY